jgi:hypothetical protein
MNSFLQHVVFGLRLIRKSPIFYLVVILVLALGIGANTAVFSVVDAVLLRKLPFRDPDRLVMVWEKNPTLGAMVGDRVPTAYTNFVEWLQQAHAFDGMAGFEDVSLNRTGTGEPERIAGARVSPNFFGVLGVSPEAGNSFDYVEADPSHSHAAMLSNGYWKSHFGGSPGVVGQTLTLNDVSYVVVGVLPANFHLPATREGSEQRKPDIWIPYESPAQRKRLRRIGFGGCGRLLLASAHGGQSGPGAGPTSGIGMTKWQRLLSSATEQLNDPGGGDLSTARIIPPSSKLLGY